MWPEPGFLAVIAGAFLLAGTVKGAVGLGLPTTVIAILTAFLDPRTAIAIMLVPILVSNAWQVWRAGETLRAMRTYAPFAICLMVGVAIVLALSADLSARWLSGLIGGAILLFVAVAVSPAAPHIRKQHDKLAQLGFGAFGGVIGGLSSLWAPAMMMYLTARRVPKEEFVRATGLLILLGSLPLTWGYIREGFLTRDLAILSTAMVLPTLAGFAVGEAIRYRLSEATFRSILLVFFAIVGLNMIRLAFYPAA